MTTLNMTLVSEAVKIREELVKFDKDSFESITGAELLNMNDSDLEELINLETAALKFKKSEKASRAYDLSGIECFVKPGDKIRAWDFEPIEGRKNAYVEGTFTRYSSDGRMVVENIFTDTLYELGQRTQIKTPPTGAVFFGEWCGRITKL